MVLLTMENPFGRPMCKQHAASPALFIHSSCSHAHMYHQICERKRKMNATFQRYVWVNEADFLW